MTRCVNPFDSGNTPALTPDATVMAFSSVSETLMKAAPVGSASCTPLSWTERRSGSAKLS